MADKDELQETTEPGAPGPRVFSTKLVVALVVVAVFAGVLVAKALAPDPQADSGAGESASITSTRTDATADYEAALKSGKPIYVLFHSLT